MIDATTSSTTKQTRSHRRIVLLCLVWTLSLILSVPQVVCIVFPRPSLVLHILQAGPQALVRELMLEIPGYFERTYFEDVAFLGTIWRNGFINEAPSDNSQLTHTNVETNEKTTIEGCEIPSSSYRETFSYGDRLWVSTSKELFEYVDGKLVNSNQTALIPSGFVLATINDPGSEPRQFLWAGEPAEFDALSSDGELNVATFANNLRGHRGKVVVPDFSRPRTIDGSTCKFNPISVAGHAYDGRDHHLFVYTDQGVLHRRGFELAPSQSVLKELQSDAVEPCSALFPANTDDDLVGWSYVHDIPQSNDFGGLDLPICIEHHPAVIFISNEGNGGLASNARLYRFVDSRWIETASMTLPFGSKYFRVVPMEEHSYWIAVTSTGICHTFRVDAEGFHKVRSTENLDFSLFNDFLFFCFVVVFVVSLIAGAILAILYFGLMWWATDPKYEFGDRSVMLAGVLSRGIARIIDVSLILGATWLVGYWRTIAFDWLNYLEAINIHAGDPTFNHPLITQGRWIMGSMAISCILCSLVFVIVQGRWGFTPGKWLMRLRAVRTTLRPCGFAKSLAREFAFLADCFCGLCWTPGLLSIAITQHRQRLGDLAADTIVVRASSLTR